jgi:hypothetical protein
MCLCPSQYDELVAEQCNMLQGRVINAERAENGSPFLPHFIVDPSCLESNTVTMRAECVVPDVDVSFAPIMPLPVRPTSLATHLAQSHKANPSMERERERIDRRTESTTQGTAGHDSRMGMCMDVGSSSEGMEGLGMGYVTLDQARRAVPLLSTESLAHEAPSVGLWVQLPWLQAKKESNGAYAMHDALGAGPRQAYDKRNYMEGSAVNSASDGRGGGSATGGGGHQTYVETVDEAIAHPLVWQACLRYRCCRAIKERVPLPTQEQADLLDPSDPISTPSIAQKRGASSSGRSSSGSSSSSSNSNSRSRSSGRYGSSSTHDPAHDSFLLMVYPAAAEGGGISAAVTPLFFEVTIKGRSGSTRTDEARQYARQPWGQGTAASSTAASSTAVSMQPSPTPATPWLPPFTLVDLTFDVTLPTTDSSNSLRIVESSRSQPLQRDFAVQGWLQEVSHPLYRSNFFTGARAADGMGVDIGATMEGLAAAELVVGGGGGGGGGRTRGKWRR